MTATVIFLNIKARVYQDVANSEQLINIIQGGSNEHSVTNQQQNTFTKLQIPQHKYNPFPCLHCQHLSFKEPREPSWTLSIIEYDELEL